MAGSWGQKQEVRSGVGSTLLRAFLFSLLLLFFSVFWVNFILQNEEIFNFFYRIVPIYLRGVADLVPFSSRRVMSVEMMWTSEVAAYRTCEDSIWIHVYS